MQNSERLVEDLEAQSEEMISRNRYGPAIKVISLALDKIHFRLPIRFMTDWLIKRIIKLYSRRINCNLKIAMNIPDSRNADKIRFLEKVLQDCNLVLLTGTYKQTLVQSVSEIHNNIKNDEKKANEMKN